MTTQSRPDRDLTGTRVPRDWCDRLGSIHRERRSQVPDHDGAVPRVPTPLGVLGVLDVIGDDGDGAAARRMGGVRQNPVISSDPEGDAAMRLYTWIADAPGASGVLLWINGVFDHTDVGASEFEKVPDGNHCADLWTITLRLPADWRGSYGIAVHVGDRTAPWRAAQGRMEVRRAAMEAAAMDPLGSHAVQGSFGSHWSVACGPLAPAEDWIDWTGAPAGGVERLDFPADGPRPAERAWVYAPPEQCEAVRTPLLVLFDGQVWKDAIGLPAILDALIDQRLIAPLHVVMVDSQDQESRWARLGVPGGQVDAVLDRILPRVRATYPVSPRGCDTAVAGQSLGGMAALWTVALGEGRVCHAIAQSASLWRFPVSAPLLREPRWRSIRLQAGTFEGSMLQDALDLSQRLAFDPMSPCRAVDVSAVHGGHDWATWRVGLVGALEELFPAG